MKKAILLLVLALPLAAMAQVPPNPKLVLVVIVDQFRYDYLTRFRQDYTEGINLLLTKGAVFADAHLDHFPTVTAIGHSVALTGAMPSVSGIIGNDWWDREEGRNVTSVTDSSTQSLGGIRGGSPRRLMVSTVGDELKDLTPDSKVIGISLKDRAAILPAGHRANGAYWFDDKNGVFCSSSYYFADLPAWVKDFNNTKPADRFRETVWLGKKLPAETAKLYPLMEATPFGNDLVEEGIEALLRFGAKAAGIEPICAEPAEKGRNRAIRWYNTGEQPTGAEE